MADSVHQVFTRHEGEEHGGEEDEPFSLLGLFSSGNVMLIHGVGMWIAWAFCLNVGEMIARYLRKTPRPYNNWFRLHVTLQTIGLIVALSSFLLIFYHIASGDDDHFEGLHQILGLIVVILLVLQVVLGIVSDRTWKPGQPPSAFDQWHWWVGRATFMLALFNLLTGVNLLQDERYKIGPVMWTFVGLFFLALFLLRSVFEIYFYNPAIGYVHKVEMYEGDSDDDDSSKKAANRPYFLFAVVYTGVFGVIVALISLLMFVDVESTRWS